MADEQSRSPIPKDFDWQSLLKRDGDELETHYRHVLRIARQTEGDARCHFPQGAE
jgi:hypothetical protein